MIMSKAEVEETPRDFGRPSDFHSCPWEIARHPAAGPDRSSVSPPKQLRRAAGHGGPALHRHINIGRIDFDAAESTAAALRGDQGRSRAEENVEDQLAAARYVLD